MKTQTLLAALLFATGWVCGADQITSQNTEGQDFHFKASEFMDKQHGEMKSMKGTGNADVDFATMMIPHHQGAIDTAKLYLKYARDPELRQQAEKMIVDQQKEIAFLQGKTKKTAVGTEESTVIKGKERRPLPTAHGAHGTGNSK